MPRADIKIDIGNDAKDYIKVVGKDINYKRSEASLYAKGNAINISIQAKDIKSLLSTINSITKQIRIVSAIGNVVDKSVKAANKAK